MQWPLHNRARAFCTSETSDKEVMKKHPTGKKSGGKRKAGARKPLRVSFTESTPVPQGSLPAGYGVLLAEIKERIRTAQIKASLSVNRELISLYWDIGRSIVGRQREEGWGKAIVERLGADLDREFPGIAGFSSGNLWRMRAFYLAWAGELPAQPARETRRKAKLAQPARELTPGKPPEPIFSIPWFHNVVIVEKLKDPAIRLWYARQAVENGWSRAVLVHQIESGLHDRQGKAVTNFKSTLPPPQSDLAAQMLKDPFHFDFLTLDTQVRERELEQGLIANLQRFLLELGKGFAFVGRQYHLTVDGDDYYIDLLFYHLNLRCYVVIDLKAVAFKPEFAGKMNFYLSAVDDQLRHPDDKPSIGLILCKERKHLTVEYALRNTAGPIGVSEYRLTKALPANLKGSLPAIKDIEAGVRNVFVVNKGDPQICPICGGRLIELSRNQEMDDIDEDATEGQMADWMGEAESGIEGNYSYDEAEYQCAKCGRIIYREEQ